MPSVSSKMKAYREQLQKGENSEEAMTRYRQMSIEQLGMERIAFGQSKLNLPFQEAFKDDRWADWFTSAYEKSTKIAHRAYILYVERRLDMHLPADMTANSNNTVPEKKSNPSTHSEAAPSDWIPTETEIDPSMEFEPISFAMMQDVEDRMTNLQESNFQLSSRMATLEMTMHEILNGVKALSVKAEP